MITTRQANIIDRSFFCSAECPHCEEEMMFEMNMEIGQVYVTVQCEFCLEISKVSVWDYFAQTN